MSALQTSSYLERRILTAFGLAFLVLTAIGMEEYRAAGRLAQESRSIGHSHEIVQELETAIELEVQSRVAARGYVLTGSAADLELYRRASLGTEHHLQHLGQLASSDPTERHRLETLNCLVEQAFRIQQGAMNARNPARPEGALLPLLEGAGRRVNAEIDELSDLVNDAELNLLERSHLAAESASRQANWFVVLGVLVAALLIALAAVALGRDVARRQRAEQSLRGLLEAAPDATVVMNLSGAVLQVNAQVTRLFGYAKEEILGRDIEILLPKRFRGQRPGGFFTESGVRPVAAGLELQGLHHDGHEFPIEISLSPFETEEDILVSAAIRDMTAHKRTEEKLRRQAAILQEQASLLDLAHDAIFVMDSEQRIVFWNRGAEAAYGWTWDEAVGQIPAVLLNTEYPQPVAELEAAFQTEGRWEGEVVHTRRDGTRVIDAARWVLQRDEQGRILRTLSINRDITTRKCAEEATRRAHEELEARVEERTAQLAQANQRLETELAERKLVEQALRANEERFTTFMENSPALAFVKDSQGRYVYLNKPFEAMFGVTRESLLGKTNFDWLPDEVARQIQRLDHQVLSSGRTAECRERLPTPTGEREILAFKFTVSDVSGQRMMGCVALDDSERARAQAEIRRLNQELETRVQMRTAQLEAANRDLEAFTYSVAHDLRAPLRQIQGFSRLLLEDRDSQLGPEAQRHLDDIVGGTKRMGQLIDDLLDLARVGRRQLSIEVAGLSALVAEVLKDLKPDTQGRAIRWQVGELPFVECDPGLMKLVFFNLLGNAIKYTRPRKLAVIEVGHTSVNGESVVFVKDNGVGFNVKYASKLFGVFQRLHRLEDFDGTGVGLATVRRIIQKHGGRIWAEAEVDKGATFYFTLGSQETKELQPEAATAPQRRAYLGGGSHMAS